MTKEDYMLEAIKEARKGAKFDEVPVGAVIVKDDKIIARAHNEKEKKQDATRHAEIVCMQKATKKLGNWWLEDCDMYVTLEPCAMCAGAMVNSRIRKLYIGTMDPKSGSTGSVVNILKPGLFNHDIQVETGIRAKECAEILSNFFKEKRQSKTGD